MRPLILILSSVLIGLMLSGHFSCAPTDRGLIFERPLDRNELSTFDLKIAMGMQPDVAGDPRLDFKISFVMPRDRLSIKLPDTFLRSERLYQRMENFRVSGDGTLTRHAQDPSLVLLEHPVGKRVYLSYRFRPDDPNLPRRESFSAPIIRDNYFQFVGLMAMPYPLALIDAPSFSVDIDVNIPEDFQFFDSFGNATKQRISTDFDKLRDAFFVGGKDLRVHKVQVRNRPVYMVFEGEWDLIDDEEFINTISRLIKEQRETWRDDNFPYFLVHFLSQPSDCSGSVNFAGTAHPNSFRAFFPSGCRFMPDMKHLISHELMHIWIGKKIKVGKQRGHIDGKWLTEGFTDFYGRLMAYRAGVLTEDEYFNSLNRQLEKYYVSRNRLVPLAVLVARMYRYGYSSKSLEDVPYQQGEIMAWRLNARIKTESNFKRSLDDVLRDMLFEANQEGGSKNFSVDEVESIVDRYSPNALEVEFAKVKYGRIFTPPKLGNCRSLYLRYHTEHFLVRSEVKSPIINYGEENASCARWLE